MTASIIDTGTVTLVNGSTALLGVGTTFAINAVTGGVMFIQYDGGNPLPIVSVADDTHAVSALEWTGPSDDYAYAISREVSEAGDIVAIFDKITDLMGRLTDAGVLGADPGWLMNFDTGTSDADPGSGNVRGSNASLASASFLYISKTSRGGSNLANWLLALDDSTNTVKGILTLLNPLSDKEASFTVVSVTDATGYVKVGVSGHAGETTFPDEAPLSVQFHRAGDAGAAGATEISTLLTTRGDIVFRNATVPARLAKGTNGTVLMMGLNDPGWVYPAMAFAESGSLGTGASKTIDLSAYIAAGYTHFRIDIDGFEPATDGATLNLTISTNAGSSFVTTNYRTAATYGSNGVVSGASAVNSTSIALNGTVGNAADERSSGSFVMKCGAAWFDLNGQFSAVNASGISGVNNVVASHKTGSVNAVKFTPSSGNIDAGTYTLWALKDS